MRSSTIRVAARLLAALAALAGGGGSATAGGAPGLPGHVAFDLAVRNLREVAIMAAGGAGLRVLTHGTSDDDPTLSPSSTQLVFVSQDRDGTHLYRLSLPTSRVARLTSGRTRDTAPAWAPNGRTLAFLRNDGGRRGGICLIDAGRVPAVRCVARGALGGPAWSPDSARVAFCARGGLVALTLRRPAVRILARVACEGAPAWSPDGKTIVVTQSVDGTAQLLAVDVASGASRRLLADASNDSEPAYSPDGAWIAFSSDRDGYDALYRVSADGTVISRLGPPGLDGANPSWSR